MRYIKNILCSALLLSVTGACSIGELDFQKNEKYEAQEVNNSINMTVWEFIQSRSDIFSTLIEGITYAGIEDLYKEPGNTHILLTNTALSSGEYAYWAQNKVLLPGRPDPLEASAWEQYSKEEVKELLSYHILKGEWSYHNLSSEVNWVETYGEGSHTYTKNGETLRGDTAIMDIHCGFDRNLPMQLNNYSWNFRGELAASAASTRTTNIHAKNGYIHVSDYYQPRPTRHFLGQD